MDTSNQRAMWVLTLILGMLLGHFVSQWASYKSLSFRMINQLVIVTADTKIKRLWRWICCQKKPVHDHPHRRPPHNSPQMPQLEQLLYMVQTLSQAASNTSRLTNVGGMSSPSFGTHESHPSDALQTRVPHSSIHSSHNTRNSHHITHRKPLRRPPSYLLPDEKS